MTYNEIRMLMDHYFSFSNKICSNENPIFVRASDDVDVDFSTTTLSGFIWECAEAAYDVWHYYHFTDDRYSGDAFVEMII